MYRKKKTMQIMYLCCLAAVLAGCGSQTGLYVKQQDNIIAEGQMTPNGTEAEDQTPQSGTAAEIYVQVSGAVENPGVYHLPEGSRIFEAIELAGGVTKQADVKSLNQAEVICDGQMVYVYAIGEQELEERMTDKTDDGRVNLNTASVEQLMTLPGIGQSKAESIVSWREEHGDFKKAEDIMNITGIKEGVFSKIKDRIKVN